MDLKTLEERMSWKHEESSPQTCMHQVSKPSMHGLMHHFQTDSQNFIRVNDFVELDI